MRDYYVYILASRSRRLYIGVTNDLRRRVSEHRRGTVRGFTSRYQIDRLVHFEVTSDVRSAIAREKTLKHLSRARKVWLIERGNPAWRDLAEDWFRDGERNEVSRGRCTGALRSGVSITAAMLATDTGE